MVRLSIIIPLYNAAKTIERLLLSLLNQKVDFLYELVLLNDGSSDDTENVVKKIINSYKGDIQISYYWHENCGVSRTRNRGIELAQGEYLMFVDADDFLEENALFTLLNARNSTTDYVISPVTFFDGTQKPERSFEPELFGTFEISHATFDKVLHASILNSPCGKVYRKSILLDKGIRFNEELSLGEDLIFNCHYFFTQEYVSIIPQSVYIYDTSQSTLTRQKREDYFNVRRASWEALQEVYDKYEMDTTIFNWLYVKMIYAYCFQLFENKVFDYREDSVELKRILELPQTIQVLQEMKPNGAYQKMLLLILKTKNIPLIFASSKIFASLRKVAPKELTNVSV